MGDYRGSTGAAPWISKPNYSIYKSPYGPKYAIPRNFHGWTFKNCMNAGLTLGAFGAVAGIFALFFFDEVPRVRKDIIQKIPIIGDHFVREIPPSDNPF